MNNPCAHVRCEITASVAKFCGPRTRVPMNNSNGAAFYASGNVASEALRHCVLLLQCEGGRGEGGRGEGGRAGGRS